MKTLKIFFIFLLVAFNSAAPAHPPTTQQLLWVQVPKANHFQARLQRYQRNQNSNWHPIGKPIPVVLGKKGLAQHKKEGDLRTPEGLYQLGPVFGFAPKAPQTLKMPYFPLKPSTLCIDDPHSSLYNRVINVKPETKRDWHSAEKMREVTLYQEGTVIQYQSGSGSCIFLHRWRSAEQGTAGCIAMDAKALTKLLLWLDAKKNPQILISGTKALNKDSQRQHSARQ